MITISDVAEYCGVSESTVSRVMNGNSKISKITADKVRSAVEELGYTPIRKKKSKPGSDEIMLVMPNPTLYTLGSTVREMSLTLHDLDFDIRIVNLHRQREITPEIAQMLCRKSTAGIILYGCVVSEEAASVFYERNIPTIVQQGDTKHLVSVCVNNYNGMSDAVEYVLSRGYRKIGFVGWEPSDFNVKTRLNSFRNVLSEADLDVAMTSFDDLNMDGGYRATEKLLDNHKPEVIVYAADIMAYGGIKYLNEMGISYPDEVGLMGFDDAYMSDVVGLTTMYQLLDENARLVIENLLEMINNKMVSPAKEIHLTPKLIIRNSLK